MRHPTEPKARAERDHWIRLFNRLDAAVRHHRKATEGGFRETHDDALYHAQDQVYRDAAKRQECAHVNVVRR